MATISVIPMTFQHAAARRRLAVQNQVDVLGLKEGSPANLARRKKIDQIARGYNIVD